MLHENSTFLFRAKRNCTMFFASYSTNSKNLFIQFCSGKKTKTYGCENKLHKMKLNTLFGTATTVHNNTQHHIKYYSQPVKSRN